MEKVAWLSPVADGVQTRAFQYALGAVSYASHHDVNIEFIGCAERQVIQDARNVLAKEFLKTQCDWAFWMDADQVIPSETIPHLLAVAKAKKAFFVSGIYYQRSGSHRAALWVKSPVLLDGSMVNEPKKERSHFFVVPGDNVTQPFKVDVCGFGCVLTHKSMFEKIKYPYFVYEGAWGTDDHCSEDFYFCIEAKKAGFQLWAAPKLKVGHIGVAPIVYHEDCKLKDKDLKQVKLEV